MTRDIGVLSRRAIQLEQSPGRTLYMFTLTGEELLSIADISRIDRDDAGAVIGYQRPEVRKHVDAIADYLNGGDVLFPNAIILAISSAVHFRHSRGPGNSDGLAAAGVLDIPLPGAGDEKPAWIVDGQQRTLALNRAKRRDLAVPVVAFVADSIDLQRDQFVRINSARPLPSGLVTELLPQIAVDISPRLSARKLPSAIVHELNTQEDSPFYGIIKRSSASNAERKAAVVTDTSLVAALQASLTDPGGCLFPYRNVATGEADVESIWALTVGYWNAVQATFPDAWGRPATRSRLMHGVGIRSMGRLMDRVMSNLEPGDPELAEHAAGELAKIEPYCHWTSGTWDDLEMRWNELQNVPRHIRILSNHLIRLYMQHR